MKTLLSLLLCGVALTSWAQRDPVTKTYRSIDNPRVLNTTALMDYWAVTKGPGLMINLFGWNAGAAGFVEVFDTDHTNAFVPISGFDSGLGFYTNTIPRTFSHGEAVQLTNTLAGVTAGIYWVSVFESNLFTLNSTKVKALTFTADKPPTGASATGMVIRLPVHTFAIAATDNYSCIVPVTGIPFGRGLLFGTSSTGGTYTLGGTNITAIVTVQTP